MLKVWLAGLVAMAACPAWAEPAKIGIDPTTAPTPPAVARPPAPPTPPIPDGPDAERFADAEAALLRFEAIWPVFPKDVDVASWSRILQDAMTRQAQALGDLQQRYMTLAATAAPEYAVPALVRTGEAFEAFAARFETLPMPRDVPAETANALRKGLSQAADAMRKVARGQYQQALVRAEATGVTGEWVDFARQRVGGSPAK